MTDDRHNPRAPTGPRPRLVLKNAPQVAAPRARFEPHAGGMGFDWSRSSRFGFGGDLFVAEFGDGSPLTTGLRPVQPRGYRVVRVNTATGATEPFLTVRNPGLATTRGPKHPIDVRFDFRGDTMYLLDFGLMSVTVALNQVGINPKPGTGALWRVRRVEAAGGVTPPPPAPAPPARVEGGQLLSWWTVRHMLLSARHDLRTALAHAQYARTAVDEADHVRHLQEARDALLSVRTWSMLALKRIDEPDVIDDGTKALLIDLAGWAYGKHLHNAVDLYPSDPRVRELDRHLRVTAFPETEELRRNYAVPGRWQRPLEKDIRR